MLRKYGYLKIVVVVFSGLILWACSDEVDKPPYDPEYIVEYQVVKTITRNQVLSMMTQAGMDVPGLSFLVRFDVEAISVVYRTTGTDGGEVLASGALFRPKSDFAFPLLSFQRGTLYEKAEAPSLFQSVYSELGGFFAATGYIVSMPDFIGYGISEDSFHPYIHKSSLATSTRDMLRASREYFKVEEITEPSEKVFLTGYSQGGYATLAAMQLMESQHANEFSIQAVTAGSGPYNVSASVSHLLQSNDSFEHIRTFVWMLDAFNHVYPGLQRPLTYYFNEPWATMIEQEGVFAEVENNPSMLLTESFRQGVLGQTDQAFLQVLADNDVYNWRPLKPLQLYHGTADEHVPFLNSQTAYDSMRSMQAASVSLIPVQNGTHLSTFFDYLRGTFSFFMPFL